jgi:hypothetical protein
MMVETTTPVPLLVTVRPAETTDVVVSVAYATVEKHAYRGCVRMTEAALPIAQARTAETTAVGEPVVLATPVLTATLEPAKKVNASQIAQELIAAKMAVAVPVAFATRVSTVRPVLVSRGRVNRIA